MYVYVCMEISVYACMCANKCVYAYLGIRVCVHVRVCVWCVCVCVCVWTHRKTN